MYRSSEQRLHSDIDKLIKSSDSIIPCSKYYLIVITTSKTDSKTIKQVQSFVKKLLASKKYDILAGYVFSNQLVLAFSSVDKAEHFLGGSHHKLCSFYVSLAVKYIGCRVECFIVECETRTLVLVFFQVCIYENMKSKICEELNKLEIRGTNLAFEEMVKELEKNGIEWDSIPTSERFGILYRYRNNKFQKMSELIDMSDTVKYNRFFFE